MSDWFSCLFAYLYCDYYILYINSEIKMEKGWFCLHSKFPIFTKIPGLFPKVPGFIPGFQKLWVFCNSICDSVGHIHKEFFSEGTTLLRTKYWNVYCKGWSEHAKQDTWTHDNPRSHTASLVQWILINRGVVPLKHVYYSSDLSLLVFFFSPKLKLALNDQRFSGISEIENNVTS